MVDQNLRLTEEGLDWQPAEVTVPSVPAVPPGGDPMSVLLSAIAPEIAMAVTQGVAEALAREERFAANVKGARTAYQNTDGAAEQQIRGAGELSGSGSGAGGVGSANAGAPAGQADQLGQMMGMPMQMAQQAAQIPMQLAGMAASIPQGIMQGVQSAMQQVGQMAGGAGEKSDLESDQQGDGSRDEAKHAERANEVPAEKAQPSTPSDGAGGPSNAERAPAPAPSPDVPQQPHKPAPTRPATSGPESVL
jgi:ESX secretion-associated protein EspJ